MTDKFGRLTNGSLEILKSATDQTTDRTVVIADISGITWSCVELKTKRENFHLMRCAVHSAAAEPPPALLPSAAASGLTPCRCCISVFWGRTEKGVHQSTDDDTTSFFRDLQQVSGQVELNWLRWHLHN